MGSITSLIVLMLVPLAIGLLIRPGSAETAAHHQPMMSKASTLAILVLLLFVVGSLIMELVVGGRDPSVRSVVGLGTAQRNVSAALVVSAQDFAGTITLSFVLVGAILLLLVMMPSAKRLGASPERAAGCGA